tara:strand:- start:3228 stop:3470 length:243 start_codon:yes stop_codon:yes gene_type:complete
MKLKQKIPKRFWTDREWAFSHLDAFQDKYDGLWVAVVDKKVAGVAQGPISARKIAKHKTGKDHIPVVFVESGQNFFSHTY